MAKPKEPLRITIQEKLVSKHIELLKKHGQEEAAESLEGMVPWLADYSNWSKQQILGLTMGEFNESLGELVEGLGGEAQKAIPFETEGSSKSGQQESAIPSPGGQTPS
jgi:hypothetical protein